MVEISDGVCSTIFAKLDSSPAAVDDSTFEELDSSAAAIDDSSTVMMPITNISLAQLSIFAVFAPLPRRLRREGLSDAAKFKDFKNLCDRCAFVFTCRFRKNP